MSQPGDSRSLSGSTWVDRVRAREYTVPPTAKTDETRPDHHVHAAPPTDKTAETPCAPAIASVLTVTPAVHVETHPSAPADSAPTRSQREESPPSGSVPADAADP